MRTRILTVVLSFCWSLIANGQNEDYLTSKIIPASPTSSALGRYGDIPVSLFNGTPSINIPLYEIKTPNHTLNIAMAYDASGTKVNEDASWVGLGWSLLSGGAITRTIIQKDDLNDSQRGFNSNFPLPDTIDDDTRESYFNDVYRGYIDAEPDIFSYNFCGKSGRFVMGKSGDGSPIFQDKKDELKISYFDNNWTITDGFGYKYYFSTAEIADNYYASTAFHATVFSGLSYYNGLGYTPLTHDNDQTISAWYLDSIVAQTGESIKFTYQRGYSLSLVNTSENYYHTFQHQSISCTIFSTYPNDLIDYFAYDYSRQEISNVYLKKIEFLNGSVEFKLSDRSDIEAGNLYGLIGPSKLDSIIIRNSDSAEVKSFAFYYSYFNSANTQGRLKLDSIAETGRTDERLLPYKFSYYNPNSLPPKNTSSIDHWGYWNGVPNQSIITYSFLLNAFGQIQAAVPYGSRDADETHNYPVNGVLSSITYPTGGSSDFEYELNEYGRLSGDQAYKTIYKDTAAYNNPLNLSSEPFKVVEFTISPITGVSEIITTLKCSYQNIVNNNLPDSGAGGPVFAQFQSIDANGNVLGTYYSKRTDEIHELNGMDETGMLLVAGKYRLSVISSAEWQYNIKLSWIQRDSISVRKGGGIRIKSIKNKDGLGKETVKKYIYNDNEGKTSGLLLNTPKYDARLWLKATATDERLLTIFCHYKMDLYMIKASNIFPSGLISGPGIVGYRQVTEIESENGKNGKTVYYYYCWPDSVNIFPGVPTSGNSTNGKLDTVLVYDSSGIVVKKTKYRYKISEVDTLRGAKLFALPTGLVPEPGNAYEGVLYDICSRWITPETETEIVYANNSAVTTTRNYYYDNNRHRQVTKESIVTSTGDTLITKFKRPDDYTVTGGNPVVEQMGDSSIILPIIEQQTLLKRGDTSKLISGTFTTFSKFNNRFYKPSIVYGIETASPLADTTESSFASNGQPSIHVNYKPKINYDQYTNLGSLSSFHGNDNISKSYLYGYNNSLPIAEIVNATPANSFHTSFEDGDGNSSDGDAKTGRKSKTGGYSKSLSNFTAGPYILSYWQKTGGTWTFQESTINVSGSSYTISLSGQVDEVRFYPSSSRMTTYTYDPLIGMTSQCDENNRTIYYEYDSFNRLKTIRDQDGKVIKTIDYQYQQTNN